MTGLMVQVVNLNQQKAIYYCNADPGLFRRRPRRHARGLGSSQRRLLVVIYIPFLQRGKDGVFFYGDISALKISHDLFYPCKPFFYIFGYGNPCRLQQVRAERDRAGYLYLFNGPCAGDFAGASKEL